MEHFEDLIASHDKIYKCYLDRELWIRKEVHLANTELKSFNKPIIELGLIDVLPEQQLYEVGKNVLLVDFQITDKTKVVKPLVEIPKSVYGIYYMPDTHNTWHSNITKDFNCFINRNDPIRQNWFYTLYERDLLNHAYASFSGLSRRGLNTGNNLDLFEDNYTQFLSGFGYNIHDGVKKLVPYKNFVETGDLCDTIMSTKFSIVLETYFERTDAITFSEKTFRVLQTPRPWLLFHSTGSIELLRNMGFYVYDDFVDHSYDMLDTSVSSTDRHELILKQTTDMLSMTVTPSMIKYWETMTLKNCEILKGFNQTWQYDVGKSINKAYNIASA